MKPTTEMTVRELEEAANGMSDGELIAAYEAERAAGPDKMRKGAIAALEATAKGRSLELGTDYLAERKEPLASTDATAEGEDHAETIRRLTADVEELKGRASGGGEVTREEVLKLHRQLEAMANHLNFRLPA